MDGTAVSQSDSEDGWAGSSGSPRTVELAGLQPNASYTVVAKREDCSDTPAERLLNGSQVMVGDISQQERLYTFRMMDSGWYFDSSTGKWYFLSTAHDGWFGRMLKGWYYDETDGNWYYLNQFTGSMMLGWQKTGGKWYYLTPGNQQRDERPLGFLYINEITPDGYRVDENGARIQETP